MSDTNKFNRYIRILSIIARIMVVLHLIVVLINVLLGDITAWHILRLFMWLVAAVGITIYLRKKK